MLPSHSDTDSGAETDDKDKISMNPWKPAILEIKPFGREYNKDFSVESRSGSGCYTLNLYSYTCTCPDFIERRGGRSIGDIGRSCKHLRDAVLSLDTNPIADELTRVIFKSPHGPYDRIWFAPDPDGEILALGITEGKPWWNLFVRKGPGGAYDRYGYHPVDRRWAYESSPPSAHEILQLLAFVPGEPPLKRE